MGRLNSGASRSAAYRAGLGWCRKCQLPRLKKCKRPTGTDEEGNLIIRSGPLCGRRVADVVAEGILGRDLREDEEVIHLDGNRLNPRWTNLMVIKKRAPDASAMQKISGRPERRLAGATRPEIAWPETCQCSPRRRRRKRPSGTDSKGYLVIKAGPLRDWRVHEVVAEGMLRRDLRKDEEVHHRDEDKLNPRFTNLQVLGKKEHGAVTAKQRWYLRTNDIKIKAEWDEYFDNLEEMPLLPPDLPEEGDVSFP